jgi:hypothetical protein
MLSWGAKSAIVIVMAGHSRPKDGVLSHAYVPANPFGMAMPCLSKPGDDK